MKTMIKLIAVAILLCIATGVDGQIKLNLKNKINSQLNNRANQKADQAINKGLDGIEKGAKDAVKGDQNKDQNQKADQDQGNNQEQEAAGNDDAGKDAKAAPQAQTALEAYSKYDFIPGEKVIFYEDFSQDAVGDFPALWNTNGSAEVVTTNLFPGHWMRFTSDNAAVWTDELLKLPDNYTVEFDAIPIKGDQGEGMAGYQFRVYQCENPRSFDGGSVPGKAGFAVDIEYFGRPNYRTYINSQEGGDLGLSGTKEGEQYKQKINQKYHIAVWMQKARVRLYIDQNKIFDLPKAFPLASVKMDRLRFEYGALMVSNIRIAVGAPDLRNKLLTEGKLVSYGIYFDVNKDIVKPESYGTLKEIAAVLTENPDVKVKIVGHTDSDGADAANLDLSKRRGASVKNELVKTFGIDTSRLESDGMGETQPVAPNDSQANKALNRRVEFIKL
jgi:outer membrane protein OmpA-like peptidoglycan-associated protein